MEQEVKAPPAVSGARQFAKVCDILDRHQRNAARLIPILQEVQGEYRYLPEEVLTFVATSLGLPPARVFGVATFYHLFSFTPPGRHTCVVCTGTACYIKGAGQLVDALREKYKVKPGQTTALDQVLAQMWRHAATGLSLSALNGFVNHHHIIVPRADIEPYGNIFESLVTLAMRSIQTGESTAFGAPSSIFR